MSDQSGSPSSAPSGAPAQRDDLTRRTRRRWIWLATAIVLAGLLGGAWYLWGRSAEDPQLAGARGRDRLSPIVVEAARTEDFPVRLAAIGNVTPRNIVTVRARVDGTLDRLLFEEGQVVRTGDLLAEIDPRPFEVVLTQAQGQLGKDQALLANARADLVRYEGLAKLDAIPTQQLDTQRALVGQYEAAIKADQGAVDAARLQLSYTHIAAPIEGRVGLRQVDPGNVVRSSDANGIVVITQVQPVTVVFPIPEAELGKLLSRLGLQVPRDARGGTRGERPAGAARPQPAAADKSDSAGDSKLRRERPAGGWSGTPRNGDAKRGDVSTGGRSGGQDHGSRRQSAAAAGQAATAGRIEVEAWDRDGKLLLATGKLLTVDNQIDATTGTVKVKAIFPNADGALFPNQFVNVRLVVSELKDVTVMPSAAVQRGSRGSFVWLLNPDDQSVSMRQVRLGPVDGESVPVLEGLKPGEQVAVDGFDRLREGAKVEVVTRDSRAVKEASGKRGGRRGPGAAGAPGGDAGSRPAGGQAQAAPGGDAPARPEGGAPREAAPRGDAPRPSS